MVIKFWKNTHHFGSFGFKYFCEVWSNIWWIRDCQVQLSRTSGEMEIIIGSFDSNIDQKLTETCLTSLDVESSLNINGFVFLKYFNPHHRKGKSTWWFSRSEENCFRKGGAFILQQVKRTTRDEPGEWSLGFGSCFVVFCKRQVVQHFTPLLLYSSCLKLVLALMSV